MALTAADYVTLADLQAEGLLPGVNIADAQDPTVVRTEALVRNAAKAVNRFCRHWFYDRTYAQGSELYLEGDNTAVLHLPAPLISVQLVQTDWTGQNDWQTVDAATYRAYTGEQDWQNPKLVRTSGSALPWAIVNQLPVWPRGARNVRLRCHLGMLEDGATPNAIKRCVVRMVDHERELVANRYGPDERTARQGRHRTKTVDGRAYAYADRLHAGLLTGDEMVDAVLTQYRRTVI